MANNYAGTPMVIDTPTTEPTNPTRLYFIKSIEWVEPDGVGDVADLRDKDGSQLFRATCVNAKENMIKHFTPPEPVYGLQVEVLDSGKLLINRQ